MDSVLSIFLFTILLLGLLGSAWKVMRQLWTDFSPLRKSIKALLLLAFASLGIFVNAKDGTNVRSMARSSIQRLSEAITRGGAALVSVRENVPVDLTPSESAITNTKWLVTGAHEDSFALRSDSSLDTPALLVASSGFLSPILRSCSSTHVPWSTLFFPLHTSLGIAPEANWHTLSHPSVFWHSQTPHGSLRLTWDHVLLNRATNAPISFQAELFPSGDFTYRYDFGSSIPSNYVIGYHHNGGGETWTLPHPVSTLELQWRAFGELPLNSIDADEDGLSDVDELYVHGTHPTQPDSDGDGLLDGEDPAPAHCDADGDRIYDGFSESDAFSEIYLAENAGFTNLVLRVLQGMPPPADEPLRRSRAIAPSNSPPTTSALLNLHGTRIPLYTGDEIPLGLPTGEFIPFQTFILGNLPVKLQLATSAPLFLDGDTRVFESGFSASGSGRLALPTLRLIPLSPHGHLCIHDNESGMAFRPVLLPMQWSDYIDYGILRGFRLLPDNTLWLDAPDPPFATATGSLEFSTPWLCTNTLAAAATIHRCTGHGSYCFACNTVHDSANACSHVSTCQARYSLESDCTCPPLFLRVNSDDDNANGLDDSSDLMITPSEDDLLSFSLSGLNSCCCIEQDPAFSSSRITYHSPSVRLRELNASPLSIGTTIEAPAISLEALTASLGIGTERITYSVLNENGSVFRTLTRSFTASRVQFKTDLDDDGILTGADSNLKIYGFGRTQPWRIATRSEPYLIFLQAETPIQDGNLSLSLTSSESDAPLLCTQDAILSPGESTNTPPFCLKNSRTSLLLDTSTITNRTIVTLTAAQHFSHTHSPQSETLSIEIIPIEIPDYTVRTNHLCDLEYDLSDIASDVHWIVEDIATGDTVDSYSGAIFTPVSTLTNGTYRVSAYIRGFFEGGYEGIVRTGRLEVCSVLLEPILSTPGENPHWNPIYVPITQYGTFHIDVGYENQIPDNEIEWTCEGVTFLNGNNRGRTVHVQPSSTNVYYTLEVHIQNFVGPTPQITFKGVEEVEVPVNVWIVHDENQFSATPAVVSNHIAGVNQIFTQVGMRFVLESISYTNNTDWMTVEARTTNGIAKINSICSITNNSNGIELYYVDEIRLPTIAVTTPKGVIVTENVNSREVAHEFGHTCDLKDIYNQNEESTLFMTDTLSKACCSLDWPCSENENYYQENRYLYSQITKLLMYGYDSPFGTDISMGDVKGLWYEYGWNTNHTQRVRVWKSNPFPRIGFDLYGTRTPVSQ